MAEEEEEEEQQEYENKRIRPRERARGQKLMQTEPISKITNEQKDYRLK